MIKRKKSSSKLPDRTFYCSFCGKPQHEVEKLIEGPSVFICDECVDLAGVIVCEHNGIHLLPDTKKALGLEIKTKLDLKDLGFNPIFKKLRFSLRKKHCFYLCPFKEPFNTIFTEHVRPAITTSGFSIERADEIYGTQAIIEDIWDGINSSEIVIADVTGRNPNVMYEIGMAHTVGRPVVIVTQNINEVPFDLRHRRCIIYEYTPKGCKHLEEQITGTLKFISK